MPVTIGVLALQGSFREHITCLNKLDGVKGIEVRTAAELATCAGLIIPGGESTTMALVAEQWGLIPQLQQFAAKGRPVWGTCAGLIFLANRASGALFVCVSCVSAPQHRDEKGRPSAAGRLGLLCAAQLFRCTDQQL